MTQNYSPSIWRVGGLAYEVAPTRWPTGAARAARALARVASAAAERAIVCRCRSCAAASARLHQSRHPAQHRAADLQRG